MRIIIIGTGNWGRALATVFSKRNEVVFWTRENSPNKNETLIGGIPCEVRFTSALRPDDFVVVAIPSRKIPDLVAQFKARGINTPSIVNVSKGLRDDTMATVGQTVRELLPGARYATLSGPNISAEIAQGLPAKAILASRDVAYLLQLREALDNDLITFEFSRDVDGVELCASLKGLVAIAVGMADGLGWKTNTFGLIMTYGLHEFRAILDFLGVSPNTVYGIAGMGDLITTCLSVDSRNRRFGFLLARGMSPEEALEEVGMVVEGVSVARTVQQLSRFNLNIPLISTVARIIFDQVPDIRGSLLKVINGIHRAQDAETQE